MLMRKGLKADIKTLDEAEIGLATDTKEIFVGTSTGNVQLAKQADVQANRDRIKNYRVDIMVDYKAVGDDVVDDGAKIQQAITDVFNAGGGTVFFPKPPVKYRWSQSILVPENVFVEGIGEGTTGSRCHYVGTGWAMMTSSKHQRNQFKKLRFDLNGSGNGLLIGAAATQLNGNIPIQFYLEDVTFENIASGKQALQTINVSHISMKRVRIGYGVVTGGNALKITADGGINSGVFKAEDCTFGRVDSTDVALEIDAPCNLDSYNFDTCYFGGQQMKAGMTDYVRSLNFEACHAEFRLLPGSSLTNIDGLQLYKVLGGGWKGGSIVCFNAANSRAFRFKTDVKAFNIEGVEANGVMGFVYSQDAAANVTNCILQEANLTNGAVAAQFSGVSNKNFKVTQATDDLNDVRNVVMTVKYYGAIGDGVSHPLSSKYSTLAAAQAVYPMATSLSDEIDWCAIQKCIDNFMAVRIPYGTYMVNKMLVYRDNVRIEGLAGKAASAIKAVSTWDNVANPAVIKMNGSFTTLKNINISCSAITDDTKKPDVILIAKDAKTSSALPWEASIYNVMTNGGKNGVYIKEGLETHITRSQFKTANASGLYIEQPDVYINDTSTDGCRKGIRTLGGSVTAHHFHAINSLEEGFYLEGADFSQFTGCHADTSGFTGYRIINTSRMMMADCWSFDSSAAASGVYSDWSLSNSTNNAFTNCESKCAVLGTQGYTTRSSMYMDATCVGNNFVNFYGDVAPWGAGVDNGADVLMNKNRFVACRGVFARYNAKLNTSKHAFTLAGGANTTLTNYLFFKPNLTANAMVLEIRITARETNAPQNLYFGKLYKAITDSTTATEMAMVDLLGTGSTAAKNFTITAALHTDGDKISITVTNGNASQSINYGIEVEYMHPPKFTA